MQDLFLTLAGLALLLLAGDALVKGAVNLSLRLGVPALVVSLTVVAFGTSAPELLIVVSAVAEGAPGLAIGNLVGSNTANVLLVLGLPALIAGMHTAEFEARKSYVFMAVGTGIFVLGALSGPIFWVHGLVFLAYLVLVLADALREARRHRAEARVAVEEEGVEGAVPGLRGWAIAGYLGAGLVGLPVGADLLVEGSVNIARSLGISEAVIGLTLVAVGTSLPELATTVAAAFRRNADVAFGNVIGSNLFNLMGVTGIAGLFATIPIDRGILLFDLWVMVGATLVLAPFVFYRINMGKRVGTLLVALYAVYAVLILT